MLTNIKNFLDHFFKKYEAKLEIAFFIGGFLFDIIFASDPDDLFSIIQQFVYLIIVASLLHFETLYRLQKWRPQGLQIRIWAYRDFMLHFLLGSLLSLYSLLYIKSASFMSSFIFLIIFLGLLIANELPQVKSAKVSLKMALYTICLFSFFAVLFPLIFGFVGWIPLLFSMSSLFAVLFFQYKKLLQSKISSVHLNAVLLFPGLSVIALFLFFYVLGWIPPVPMSVKEQGIYHKLEKINGKFHLFYKPNSFKFWQDYNSNFLAEPSDQIYFYAQIYSPSRISDTIFIHWQFKNKKNDWVTADRIPLQIQGGRKEGFRGYAVKSNYQPGEYKVSIETTLGSEISRLYFTVEPVPVSALSSHVQPNFNSEMIEIIR